MKQWAKRLVPLVMLAAVAAAALTLGLHEYLSPEALRQNQALLQAYVQDHPVLSAGAYVSVYAIVVAVSLPGATFMSLMGGFLFGLAAGSALAVVAATIGATLVFLAARTAVGDSLRRRSGPYLRRIEESFRSDAFNYILFLRLIPIFPFWAVNLSMALLRVRLSTYVIATAIGIIPVAVLIVAVGAGLSDLVEMGGRVGFTELLSPNILLALSGLAILSMLPVVVRRWRARNGR